MVIKYNNNTSPDYISPKIINSRSFGNLFCNFGDRIDEMVSLPPIQVQFFPFIHVYAEIFTFVF